MASRKDKQINHQIEEAFYLKAVGGLQQREEKTITEDDGKGLSKEKREVTVKQLPPDLDAIKAWLRERSPERWHTESDKGQSGVIRVITSVPRPEEQEGG